MYGFVQTFPRRCRKKLYEIRARFENTLVVGSYPIVCDETIFITVAEGVREMPRPAVRDFIFARSINMPGEVAFFDGRTSSFRFRLRNRENKQNGGAKVPKCATSIISGHAVR